MAIELKFTLPVGLYVKEPQETKFGKRLLESAIELIYELGFESFTFKKLALRLNSSEVSIYRYFENKHFLLLYLNSWYWEWMHYLISQATNNLSDSKLKLERAIHCILFASKESKLIEYVNENKLHNIVLNEGAKTYHIQQVDKENQLGLYLPYKNLNEKISNIINEYNPKFAYPKTLCSTILDMANNQIFYVDHLPKLTDIKKKNKYKELEKVMKDFVFSILQ